MRALVTGATGFAGRHLTRALLARGYQVTGMARTAGGAQALKNDGIATAMGDVRDAAAVAEAVQGADVVFHLAAAFRQAKLADSEYAAVNVEGTRIVLEAAVRASVRRFVHCSTVGVHGDTGSAPAAETTPLGVLDDAYNRTKLEAEHVALELFRRTGMEGVVLRPSVGYGPGEPRYAKLFRSIRRGRFVMIGSGETLYNMVYITDVCDGVIRAAERPEAAGEVIILGGAENITLNTLVGLIAELVGGRVSRLRVPLAPIRWAGEVCERICRPLGIEPPLHPRRVGFFTVNRAFDIGKARRLLGYAPAVPLREGLATMADWYRSQGLL
jgi:dihydroflavonol-4-reductase